MQHLNFIQRSRHPLTRYVYFEQVVAYIIAFAIGIGFMIILLSGWWLVPMAWRLIIYTRDWLWSWWILPPL